MKRSIVVSVLLILMILLAGCAKNSGEKVYVYNWGEYMDPEVRKLFKEETGITVVYEEFEQNEDMYTRVQSGAVSYDVICPSDYMIQKMIDNDLLYQPNFDNIPNLKYIDESYLVSAQEYDPGNKYSVPYTWGTLGILYNTTMVDETIDSWEVLFDEKYSGEILMIDSVRDAFAIALQYLGYDLNSTDETELEEAKIGRASCRERV